MNYGFLIRNDRCIGCHACSTACKSENDVPLGVNRTWVKNVEKGRYPDVRRTFQVTRCNHCANPPCVTICPVSAMYQRSDGIVEFDGDRCIGCKACLQACPYDAIYIDPESGTAAKCHYCAHRTDIGLEPACVVVCPEHAIVAGDMDDPASEISTMLADFDVTVRKPEQGTAPKLFYVDGDEAAMQPTALERAPAGFAWADVVPLGGPPGTAPAKGVGSGSSGERDTRSEGPIRVGGGRMAGEIVQGVYNAQHVVPWRWPVPAYLVTKAVAAGSFLILAAGHLMGLFGFDVRAYVAVGLASLVFQALTTGLLVLDLERPERFLRVLTRPQWRSWLVRGAYILVLFSLVTAGWWIAEVGASVGWWSGGPVRAVRAPLLGVGGALALGAAVYTGFLFGQAEGRDLWQSPLLPVHLLVQAALAGSAALAVMHPVWPLPDAMASLVRATLVGALTADLLVLLLGDFGMSHASDTAAAAARSMRRGRYRLHAVVMGIGVGHVIALGLAVVGGTWGAFGAGLAALVGLYFYEYAFVLAPQEVPNS